MKTNRGFVKGQEDTGSHPDAQGRAGIDNSGQAPDSRPPRGTSVKSPVPDCTPDQQLRLDALRAALPPIYEWDVASGTSLMRVTSDTPVCLDCEWNEDTGELTTIGVGNEDAVVQIDWSALSEFDRTEVRRDVEALVRRVPVIYQSAISDIKKLRQNGFKIHPKDHRQLDDTMLADAVVNAELDHDLGSLNARYGRLPDYKDLRKVAPKEYNAADLVATVMVWKYGLAPALELDPAAERIYREFSLAYLAELQLEQEEAGIRVDKSKPYPLRDKFSEKIEQATKLAQSYCGFPVNLKSPDDMKHMLYEVEQMPVQRKKAPRGVQGEVTTDKDAISVLRRLHGTEWDPDDEPTLEAAWAAIDDGGHPLLEARYLMMGAQQSLSHYVDPVFEFDGDNDTIVGIRDRIYPEVRIHVQSTARHSYVGPAVQQMKGDVAELLTPDPGMVWVGWDWSQIEVRLLAVLADDEPYLAAFARGDDIHELNVRAIFGPKGTPELEVIRRGFGKRFVFRLHYRGKPEHAGDIPGAKALNLNEPKLIEASEAYLGAHPAIPKYWARIEAQAERSRTVYNFMGRCRRLTSEYRNARNREACNYPMQAGVSDVYIETALMLKRAAPYARLVFGAHDAQTWQLPEEREPEFTALAKEIAQRPFVINGRETVFPAEFKRKIAA